MPSKLITLAILSGLAGLCLAAERFKRYMRQPDFDTTTQSFRRRILNQDRQDYYDRS